jgi:hypothetical protein
MSMYASISISMSGDRVHSRCLRPCPCLSLSVCIRVRACVCVHVRVCVRVPVTTAYYFSVINLQYEDPFSQS